MKYDNLDQYLSIIQEYDCILDRFTTSEIINILKNENLEYLDEGKINDWFKNKAKYVSKRMDILNKNLEQNKIRTDKYNKKLEELSKKHSIEIVNEIKKKNVKGVTEKTEVALKDVGEWIIEVVKIEIFNNPKKALFKDLPLSIANMFVMVLTGRFIKMLIIRTLSLLGFVASPALLVLISCIFIAPIVEEGAKFIAIQMGFSGTFLLVFNVMEFTKYLKIWKKQGLSMLGAVIARSWGVVQHYATSILQNIYSKLFQKEGMGETKVINCKT